MEIFDTIEILKYAIIDYNNERIEFFENNSKLDSIYATKLEILETIKYLLTKDKQDFELIELLTSKIHNFSLTSKEIKYYNKLKKQIEYMKLNKEYNILKYTENKHLQFIMNYNKKIEDEYRHINQYINGQNKFDNLLSLIKAIQRLKMDNINIKMNLNFDSTKDESNDNANALLIEGYESFKNMRFMI